MKVSIITTCYNRKDTIGDAIKSVLAQTYPDIEYIIVDGASKDGSWEVIKQYKDKVAVAVSEPDHGMYEAINKGIRMATGDIVGLIHSDDFFYSNDTVAHIVKKFEETGADLVYGDGLFVDSKNTDNIIRNWVSGTYCKHKIREGWLPLHTTVYIRRGVFDKLGLYNEAFRISADSDLLVRYLYDANLKVAYLPEYIIKMRMGGLSTDPVKTRKKWLEDIAMYRKHNLPGYRTLARKVLSKIPQFISAKLINA